ncbi:MAG: hypothetical protein F6J97_16790 [Leptolyngbya sp. SIO4C1]|nr:hypothetical protein [Leptolyngbya sp. SIO4C1]
MNRKFFSIALVFGLLSGCGAQTEPPTVSVSENNTTPETTGNAANCPAPDESLAALQQPENGLVFEQLNFRPETAAATDDTVAFENDLYRFVFCRADQTWSVLASDAAADPEIDYDAMIAQIADPDYEAIELADETYEARVRLEAEWLSNPSTAAPPDPDAEKVVFELIKPGDTEPTATVLYTLADLEAKGFGASLGPPQISRALAYDGSLWWAITFEQGEGNSGIATVVQYQPESDQMTLWQPEALGSTQITDMALTGTGDDLTLWLGTQFAGEGNPYLPAAGLVAYTPSTETVATYSVHNSPLIGAIPAQLLRLEDSLWIGTGNGACEVQWQTIDEADSWDCWRFTAMAAVPDEGVPLYESLLAEAAATMLEAESVEVLWAADTVLESETGEPRYEVRYPEGFELTVDLGAQRYEQGSLYNDAVPANFYWPGTDWHWSGSRFERSQDEVAENHFGGGPQGIGPADYVGYVSDWNAIRGDLELLELTSNETQVRYFSGWVDTEALAPYPTVVEAEQPEQRAPNPLEPIKQTLEPTDPFSEAG